MFRKLLATTPTWITVPLRLTMGLLFALHGAEKVFGMRGGKGLSGWMSNEALAFGLRPPWIWLAAAAFLELIGGILILTGFLTRIGALFVIPIMLVAIYGTVKTDVGPIPLPQVGYPLVMLGSAMAILIAGGGRVSVDHQIAKSRRWR